MTTFEFSTQNISESFIHQININIEVLPKISSEYVPTEFQGGVALCVNILSQG